MRYARALVYALLAVTFIATAASAQDLDISGWTLQQENSTQSFTFPGGTIVSPGGYVIVARDVDQPAFEAYFGVLGSNVTYVRSSNSVPMINGAETYILLNGSGVVQDGPTDAVTTTKRSYHRNDPETPGWMVIDLLPSPGTGVEAPDGVLSGLVISELTDADDYIYEYLELYYDATAGTGGQYPLITNVLNSPSSPVNGDDVTVSCSVTDSDGTIDLVWIWSRTDSGSFLPTNMTHQGGGVYSHTFTNMSGGLELQYYLWARDDESNESISPVGAPSSFYSVYISPGATAGKVVLFDHAHSQDAGTSGNWRVDDNHPLPSPSVPTSETSWNGQLSSWGYELFLAGHTIRSNTSDISSAQLADVDMLVIVEPQDRFTATEIAAIDQFVFNGGSLFTVANHNASDRNSNGWDSPSIFGGYSIPHIFDPVGSDTETFMGARFGLHYHVKDEGNNSITGTFTYLDTDPTNPVLYGPFGDVSAVIYHVGDVMSLWPTANGDLSDVGALISKDGGSPHVAAWSRYGLGRVVGYGDSSSCADGTGSESHNNNWLEAGSDNRSFFLNASTWLLSSEALATGDTLPLPGLDLRAAPNPFNPSTQVRFTMPSAGGVSVTVHDIKGRKVRTLLTGIRDAGTHVITFDGRTDEGTALPSGVYLIRATGRTMVSWTKVMLAK